MTKPWNPEHALKERHYPAVKYWDEEKSRYVRVRLPDEISDDVISFPVARSSENMNVSTYTEDDFIYGDNVFTDADETEIYNPSYHDAFALMCPDMGCAAPMCCVDKNRETGRTRYWKSRNNLDHAETCKYKNRDYDPHKGFLGRASMEKFADAQSPETMLRKLSGKYARYSQRHPSLVKTFETLRKREPYKFEDIDGFIDLYKKGGLARAMDSLFDVNGVILKEEEFLIRRSIPGEPNRFKHLHDRLSDLPAGNHLPCVMQFHVPQDRDVGYLSPSIAAQGIFIYREMGETGHDGNVHYARPRAFDRQTDSPLRHELSHAGDYFMFGFVSLGDVIRRHGAVIHYLDINVYRPGQIRKVEMAQFQPQPFQPPEIQPRFSFLPNLK